MTLLSPTSSIIIASTSWIKTYVYPGVFASLDSLRFEPGRDQVHGGAHQQTHRTSKAICDALGLSPYFFRIYGGNSFSTKKPDPEGLLALLKEAGVRAQETLMIGDSNVDIRTARNAGVWSMGCAYGLAPQTLVTEPPDCSLTHPPTGPWPWPARVRNWPTRAERPHTTKSLVDKQQLSPY